MRCKMFSYVRLDNTLYYIYYARKENSISIQSTKISVPRGTNKNL